MRADRFTTKSREALAAAQSEAMRRGNPELTPEHLMLAMLQQDQGVVPALVQKAGADPRAAVVEFERVVDKLPRVSGGADPSLSRRLGTVMQKAEDEAKTLKDEYVSAEHFVLAMIKHDREVGAILKKFGLDEARFLGVLWDPLESTCRHASLSIL